MIVLGIESSCDETACAIVNDKREIMAHQLNSQKEHVEFGGVVPEIAARAHLEKIDEIVIDTLKQANLDLSQVDAIAAAAGPGLIGGVVVGVMTAKAMCLALNKPFIAVNHLEGHALCARINTKAEFPYLLLLVSGGHCQFLIVEGVGKYKKLGGTIDDAVGEAFDKVAKMLKFEYPGGPMIEKLAYGGNSNRFVLPRPLQRTDDYNLSFSGLKTAVRKIIELSSPDGKLEHAMLNPTDVADLCAGFQQAVADCLATKLEKAIKYFKSNYPDGKDFVISGGVAANMFIRGELEKITNKYGLAFCAPPIKFCTDNGVMIAWAGLERFQASLVNDLDFRPRPRWPLDEL